MAFSLACDAGKTTLRIEGTDSNVTWNAVANAGAGSVAVDGGGTEDPSFFVTEHVANAIYQILKNVRFGDGTNALIFYSKKEMVYFDDGRTFTIKDNATLQLGEIAGDYCIKGACWSWGQSGYIIADSNPNAVCNIYGSQMMSRLSSGYIYFKNGTIDFRNSTFMNVSKTSGLYIAPEVDNVTFKDLYICNYAAFYCYKTPDICEGLWIHYTTNGFTCGVSVTLFEPRITNETSNQIYLLYEDKTVTLQNPQFTLLKNRLVITGASSKILSQFTCDIHVVDKDGKDLEGVTVTCEDKNSDQVFSVQTGADGKIAQQTLTYKGWEGTDETETEYSPHKFTFSKNGYILLVMENVTVDARINWDIEVKFPKRIRARMANLGRLAILR